MKYDKIFLNKISKINKDLLKKNLKIVTAESCTGGLLSSLFTAINNSSLIFDCGFITYSNASKNSLLKVKKNSLKKFGAVSEEVAIEMSKGALKNSNANIAIAITGISGPNGGSLSKPIGTTFINLSSKNYCETKKFIFNGNRDENRDNSVLEALNILDNFLKMQ